MTFKTNLIPLLSICLFSVSSTSFAHEDEGNAQRAIEYRQSIMTLFGWNMKPMGAMMKDKMPYDQAAFARYAGDLQATAGLDLLAGFPPDSEGEDSDARPDIWFDFADFQQKYKNLQTAAENLKQTAKSGDKTNIKPAFEALGKACKACHRAYKD